MKKGWIFLLLLGAAGYIAVFGGDYSWPELHRLERERRAQLRAVQATQREVKALRARADSLERDSLAVERLARERYGLIRNGERLYRFADGATFPSLSPPAAGSSSQPPGVSPFRSLSLQPSRGAVDSNAARRIGARHTPGRNPR